MYILQNCSFWSFSVSSFFFVCNLPIQKTYCTTVSRYSRRLFEKSIETTDSSLQALAGSGKISCFSMLFKKEVLYGYCFLDPLYYPSLHYFYLAVYLSLLYHPPFLYLYLSVCLSIPSPLSPEPEFSVYIPESIFLW